MFWCISVRNILIFGLANSTFLACRPIESGTNSGTSGSSTSDSAPSTIPAAACTTSSGTTWTPSASTTLKGKIIEAWYSRSDQPRISATPENRLYVYAQTIESSFPSRYTQLMTRGYIGSEFTLDLVKDYVKSKSPCDVCWTVNLSLRKDQTNQGTAAVGGVEKEICVSSTADARLKYGEISNGTDLTFDIEWTLMK